MCQNEPHSKKMENYKGSPEDRRSLDVCQTSVSRFYFQPVTPSDKTANSVLIKKNEAK